MVVALTHSVNLLVSESEFESDSKLPGVSHRLRSLALANELTKDFFVPNASRSRRPSRGAAEAAVSPDRDVTPICRQQQSGQAHTASRSPPPDVTPPTADDRTHARPGWSGLISIHSYLHTDKQNSETKV